jgi:hypothetical protein
MLEIESLQRSGAGLVRQAQKIPTCLLHRNSDQTPQDDRCQECWVGEFSLKDWILHQVKVPVATALREKYNFQSFLVKRDGKKHK